MSLMSESEEPTAIRGRTAENPLPLLMDAYRELLKILEPLGVRSIITGNTTHGSIKK